jgi:hypothetical protein
MSDNLNEFDRLLSEDYDLDIQAPIKNTGTAFERFKHIAGEYRGIFGRVKVYYKDVDGERCEKGDVGATRDFAMGDLVITKSPDAHGLDANLKIPANASYGSLMYKQYITLDEENQWKNKALFEEFRIDDNPKMDVVQYGENFNSDPSDFSVDLSQLTYYLGMPVTFTIAIGKKGSAYITGIFLANKKLNVDVFQKRVKFMDALYAEFEALLEKETEEREAKKGKESEELPLDTTEVTSADDILSEYE